MFSFVFLFLSWNTSNLSRTKSIIRIHNTNRFTDFSTYSNHILEGDKKSKESGRDRSKESGSEDSDNDGDDCQTKGVVEKSKNDFVQIICKDFCKAQLCGDVLWITVANGFLSCILFWLLVAAGSYDGLLCFCFWFCFVRWSWSWDWDWVGLVLD